MNLRRQSAVELVGQSLCQSTWPESVELAVCPPHVYFGVRWPPSYPAHRSVWGLKTSVRSRMVR